MRVGNNNKRRVTVSIYHRGRLSLGEHRTRLDHNAYHWGILITPKTFTGGQCQAYDVSDAFRRDPDTLRDMNPERKWYFRAKVKIDPAKEPALLGRVVIGKLANSITDKEIKDVLSKVPLPDEDKTKGESCVTWCLNAVEAMQKAGMIKLFDIEAFRRTALEKADLFIKTPAEDHVYIYAQ
ncbi:hypothetical protein MBLNU457_5991t1 [Dothideomycetes sp. NU457]